MPNNVAKAIELAAITGAHGVTGEVRLKLFGDGIASLKPHKSFNEGALTLSKLRDDNKGGAIARFAQITNRNDAEKARGTVLTIAREALPALEEGEYYHADLVGLAAISASGEELGVVVTIMNYGAGDIVEIERPTGKKFMIPMNDQAVPSWDAKKLVVADDFADS